VDVRARHADDRKVDGLGDICDRDAAREAVGAIGGVFAFLPVLLSPVFRLREIPTQVAEA